MNAGLGNLATLKRFVLAEAMATQAVYDARLVTIGLGVASRFEQFCNRKLRRTVGDTFTVSADRGYLIVPRLPLETVTKLEQRDDVATGWVELDLSTLLNQDEASGMLDFGFQLGPHTSMLRVTYTGGFYFETLEPTDDGYPTTQPAGSTIIPDDLRDAWMLQSQKIFERTRSLSTAGIKKPEEPTSYAPSVKLDEGIEAMLNPYRRFAQ